MAELRSWQSIRLDRRVPIAVATKNHDKFREISTLWGSFLPPVVTAGDEYPDIDEHGATYQENAIAKASALANLVGGPALADDSGIEVEAMDWGPGVRSARTPYVGAPSPVRNEHVLRSIEGKARNARFVCACAIVLPGYEPVVARGEVEGLIAEQPMGENGFGYDPIFWYPPYSATFGQLDAAHKDTVSHRGNAVHALQAKIAFLVAPVQK